MDRWPCVNCDGGMPCKDRCRAAHCFPKCSVLTEPGGFAGLEQSYSYWFGRKQQRRALVFLALDLDGFFYLALYIHTYIHFAHISRHSEC